MLRRTDSLVSATQRQGAAAVEFAVVLPVFLVFAYALIEFGHAFMCNAALTAAAKDAARFGAIEGVTAQEVKDRAKQRVSKSFNSALATVLVKNASSFEASGTDTASIAVSSLPDITLEDAEERQLFIVRIEVPYNQIAVMPPLWAKSITLHAESVMRHE